MRPAAAGAGGPGELAAGARAGVPVAGGAAAPEPRGAGPAAAGVPAEPGAAEGGPAPGGEGAGQDARPAEPAERLEAQPAEQPSRGLLSGKRGGTGGSSVLAKAVWRAAASGTGSLALLSLCFLCKRSQERFNMQKLGTSPDSAHAA